MLLGGDEPIACVCDWNDTVLFRKASESLALTSVSDSMAPSLEILIGRSLCTRNRL